MKKQLIKLIGALMLVVFFLGIAPKEYIHDVLFHHHDTVHPLYKKGEVVVTGKHIHCSFLGFEFASFISSERQSIFFHSSQGHEHSYLFPVYDYRYASFSSTISLRGPPRYSMQS